MPSLIQESETERYSPSEPIVEWGKRLLHEILHDPRVTRIALGVLAIIALVITTTIFSIGTPFLIYALPIGAALVGSGALIAHAYSIYNSHQSNKASSEKEKVAATAERVDALFKHILIHLVILGSVTLGAAVSSAVIGISALVAAASTGSILTIMGGIIGITLSLGVLFPIGRRLISTAYELHENHAEDFVDGLKNIIVNAIQHGKAGFMVSVTLFLDELLVYLGNVLQPNLLERRLLENLDLLSHLTDEELMHYFKQSVSSLSENGLEALLSKSQQRLSMNGILHTLLESDEAAQRKLSRILLKQINRALRSDGFLHLEALHEEFEAFIHHLEERLSGWDQAQSNVEISSLKDLDQQLTRILDKVSYTRFYFAPYLDEDILKNIEPGLLPPELSAALSRLLTKRHAFSDLLNRVSGAMGLAARHRLERLRHHWLPPSEPEEVEEEEAYMALSYLGFRLEDFGRLAKDLELPLSRNDSPIKALSTAMRRAGLKTKEDLVEAQIISEDHEPNSELLKQKVHRALVTFLKERKPWINWSVVIETVQEVALFVLNYIIPAALISLILYTSPLATVLGITAGLFIRWTIEEEVVESPSNLPQTFEERMRSIFYQLFASWIVLAFGPIGALAAGAYVANDLRTHTVSLYQRMIA